MVLKKCEECGKEFELKQNPDRICLEFRNKRDKKGLRRLYYCSKECFASNVKKFLR